MYYVGNRSNTSNCPKPIASTSVHRAWSTNGPSKGINYTDSAPNESGIIGIIAGTICGGILVITFLVCIKMHVCSKSKVASKPIQAPSRPPHPVWSMS
ncbi:hypothetical protein CHS0354_011209 [Potamilus streckersoni]|uniref:Uncharacterized protein n=1 Tax=Potamilus streckersoni TaxID=2493646 RepID=A0AAE0T287_9BIVA|nr:hypothetical protein CHS0354_011209 [Potamilus streckersoni]